MIQPLGTTQHGCFLFADITGYTKFIDSTEITHAQDVIGDLIETMVGVVTPTFRLSRVEGDAVFAFAPTGDLSPALVLDTVDSTYFAFRKRLREVTQATTCPCQACHLMPSLDLKFFLHEGEYAVRSVAGFTELSGMDVIVLHRLAKGTASPVVGGKAYAVFTRPIIETMGVDPDRLGLIPHVEEFADTGQIEVFVQDMQMRWEADQAASDIVVSPDDAMRVWEMDLAASPQEVWTHLNSPEGRVRWQPHVTGVVPTTGRMEAGSVNHCMHGPDVTVEEILTWRPFSHVTFRYDEDPWDNWLVTYRMEPIEGGTRFTVLLGDPGDWAAMEDQLTELFESILALFREQVGTL